MRYEDVVLADGPVGYWPLTETSGTTAVDLAGSATGTHTNVAVGASPFPGGGVAAVYGPASNNSRTALTYATTFASSTITIEAWVRQDALTLPESVGCVVNIQDTTVNNYIRTRNSTGDLECGFNGIGGGIAGAVMPLGRWHHIVWVQAGTLRTVYKNGRVFSTATLGGSPASSSSGTRNGWIGGGAGASATDWSDDHAVAHVAYYVKALTSGRVEAHYRAGLGPAYRRRAA